MDQLQPGPKPFAELALPRILLNAELARESERSKQRNSFDAAGLIAAPRQPRIQIEASRVVRERTYDSGINWDRMIPKLFPERSRQRDQILSPPSIGMAIVLKPKAHVIHEMDAAAVPDFRSAALRLSAEEDRAPENAPKRTGEPAIVFATGGQAPVGQDLRGALEADYRTPGPHRLCCEPR
jgi:hypothetical protein